MRNDRPVPVIVLNGLNLPLEGSGGVARYAAKLRDGLREHQRSVSASRFEVRAIHFPDERAANPLAVADIAVAPPPEASTQRPPQPSAAPTPRLQDALLRSIRSTASNLLPSGFYRSLRRHYWRARRLPRSDAPTAAEVMPTSEVPSQPATPVPLSETLANPSGEPWLMHQVAQYIVDPSIGRRAFDKTVRVCVTIIDHQELFFPAHFSDDEITRRHTSSLFFADRADHCFAISQFSKDIFCERYRVEADRVTVTHLASDDAPASPEASRWARRLGRYFLYPAKAWPHKNHSQLIAAVARSSDALREHDVRLVLTGGFTTGEATALSELSYAAGIADLVQVLGFVSDERLAALYEHADWLVFPSRFEGFGMPVVEAMRRSCPVMASNVTALPETCGGAALLFDPLNIGELADALEAAARQELPRSNHVSLGRANARRFDWASTVQRTVRVYDSLLSVDGWV